MADSIHLGALPALRGRGRKGLQCQQAFLNADSSCSAGMQDGKYLKKRNTFTDVVASAEHLIAEKYTSKSMLCIQVRQPFPYPAVS